MNLAKKILLSSVGAFLSACGFTPAYQTPAPAIPSSWHSISAEVVEERDSASVADLRWWKSFGNDDLTQLIHKSIVQNQELKAAWYRVEQVRALRAASRASLFPSVDGGVSFQDISRRSDGRRTSAESVSAGLGVTYELDLFGGNHAGRLAADEALASQEYARESLRILILAELADAFFRYHGARQRIEVANESLTNARELLRITEELFAAGGVSALDVARQNTTVANFEAQRLTTQQEVENAANAIAVLTGEAPGALLLVSVELRALTVPQIGVSQPFSLLERRPDILAAESNIREAQADIGLARAAFFPNVVLGLSFDVQSMNFETPLSTAFGFLTTLAAPVFQGGRLRAGLDRAVAGQNEQIAHYRQTVLTSLQEIENALVRLSVAKGREQAFESALASSREAYELSRTLYTEGRIDFQTLLDSQRTLFDAQSNEVSAREERLRASVSLYKSIGGGWL